jgi:hypothetical protein
MSKFIQSNEIDELGGKILRLALNESYFGFLPINGNYPDIDGEIRLRDGISNNLNKFLHYQLKSKASIKNEKFFCSRKIINYLTISSVPTLLFVVDISINKVYWFFFDESIKRSFGLEKDKKGRTINLRGMEVNRTIGSDLCGKWSLFARKQTYREVSESLKEVVNEFENNSINCVGLLYLFRVVRKKEAAKLFSEILKTPKQEIEVIIRRFTEKKIISETVDLYLIENDKIGLESLDELLSIIPIKDIYHYVKEDNQKQNILVQLAGLDNQNSLDYLLEYGNQIRKSIAASTSNDEINEYLSLLEKFSYRTPDLIIKISKDIINSDPISIQEYKYVWGIHKGFSHQQIISKLIEINNNLRYQKPIKILNLLIKLSLFDEYKKLSLDAISALADYNLIILKRVGYLYQFQLLDEIETWGNRKLLKYHFALQKISKKLLSSEFEGISMVDYKTVSIQFGPLLASKKISNIRNRTINILKIIFLSTKNTTIRKEVLKTLKVADKTPTRGNYSPELENIIIDNINSIFDFYLENISMLDEELIIEIEEEVIWINRRFGNKKIPKINDIREKISSNEEYLKFKTFYGFDFIFDDTDWRNNREKRIESINKNVKGINAKNRKVWEKRIKKVSEKYSLEEAGKFVYFNYFLQNLGKEKPSFALTLLEGKSDNLNPFKIHLITGILNSSEKTKGEEVIVDWINENENLEIISSLYNQAVNFNLRIYKKIVQKVIKTKNKKLLKNILITCIEKFTENEILKEIFFRIIRKLIRLKDKSWGSSIIWISDYSIFSSFSNSEAELFLSSLILHQRIEFHLKSMLLPIMENYPRKVIQFLYKRIGFHLKNTDDYLYDPLPLGFIDLQKPFQTNGKLILPEIKSWYSEQNRIYHLHASRLLKQIYPSFDNELLKASVSELIENGGEKNAFIALSFLRAYEGDLVIYGICKLFIKKYFKDKLDKNYNHFNNEMMIILSQTGIVSGEYGLSNAYKAKKEEIQSWKKEDDEILLDFVKNYEQYLDRHIKLCKEKADEDIVLMKKGIR